MKIREMLLSGTFVTMMIISAYIIVPIGPVPITMQPLVVLLAGMLLGSRLSAVSICVWVCSAAWDCLYSIRDRAELCACRTYRRLYHCFIITAWLVGYLTERDLEASYLKNLMYMCVGMLVCYAIGLIGFKLSFQYFLQKPMSWDNAILLAVAPFLPFDIIKAAAAALIGAKVRKALLLAGLLERTK